MTSPEDSSADTGVSTAGRTERLILDVAAAELAGAAPDGDLLVIDDGTGALVAGALDLADRGARVLAWHRSAGATARTAQEFRDEVSAGRLLILGEGRALEEAMAGSRVGLALGHLPKSLRALEGTARSLARSADGALTLVAGGRVKHMSRSQNDILAASFRDVHASRGSGKSRCLVASGPRSGVTARPPDRGRADIAVRGERRSLPLRGIGAVFGGARPDAGSLLLLACLDEAMTRGEAEAARAVDLGCGNGLLTAYLAAALPDDAVSASDDDRDAVAATVATLAAAGLDREGVSVTWSPSLAQEDPASADLLVLNPPFHDGTAIDATLVQGLLDVSARVLRPGGQLWFVHNSHLRYRPEVERRVGPVEQRGRDRRFTVLRALRA